MRYLVELLIFFGLAGAIGLGLTGLAVDRDVMFGQLQIGQWIAVPGAGSPEPDPYARASMARRGRVPLALGDGLELFAQSDDTGEPLRLGCEYEISGGSMPARYWTLALMEPSGQAVATPLGRAGFTSHELLRREDGSYSITLAPQARPGNWLSSNGTGHFRLALRLYDTPLTTRTERTGTTSFPSIRKVSCP